MQAQNTQEQNSGKTIKPINNNGSISIQFQLEGKTYKFNPIKKGKFEDPIALGKAKAIAEQITRDIQLEEFDSTLAKYIPKSYLTVIESIKKPELNIVQVFEKYLEFKKPELKESTLHYLKTSVYVYLVKCPYKNLDNALEVRQWLLSNTTNSMTKRILTHLNAAIKWAIKHKVTSLKTSLFEGMAQELPKHKWEQDPKPNAFIQEEKEAIINAFENHQGNWNGRGFTGSNYRHYASIIKFWFLTGCRPSEGIGLTWGQISEDCSVIIFDRAIVQLGSKKFESEGSKNSRYRKNRKFPCPQKLKTLLLSIKPDFPNPNDLVFPSKTGKIIDYNNFCKRAWDRIVDPIVKRNSTPYSCRDTFMSEQVSKGIAPEIVARWCDSSPDTIRKHYLDDKLLEHLRPID